MSGQWLLINEATCYVWPNTKIFADEYREKASSILSEILSSKQQPLEEAER